MTGKCPECIWTGTFSSREDGLYEKCEEEHVQKAYSIEAIKAMIVKAGMELVAVYDAYTHNPGDEIVNVWLLLQESMEKCTERISWKDSGETWDTSRGLMRL